MGSAQRELTLVALVALVCGAGCGRVGFDAGDAATDAVPASGPFSSPQPVTELDPPTGYFSDDPSVTADELLIMFTSNRPGSASCDVWTSTRTSSAEPWPTPINAGSSLNFAGCDSGAALAGDGLSIWTTRNDGTIYDIYTATRPTRDALWDPPQLESISDVTAVDGGSSVTPDGRVLVFHSNRTGVNRLYQSIRASADDPWPAPALLAEIANGSFQEEPGLSADGLTLWYAADTGAAGDTEIWTATRTSLMAPFGMPVHEAALSSPDDDGDPWVSADGHTLYFSRWAAEGSIFIATR